MLLSVQNVAKISTASIEINGITVIAGENNTGKSTIGKILYCLYNSFYNVEDKIQNERILKITSEIRKSLRFMVSPNNQAMRIPQIARISDEIIKGINNSNDSAESLKGKIDHVLLNINKSVNLNVIDQDEINKLSSKIYEIVKITDGEIQEIILNRYFNMEFSSQINHLNDSNSSAMTSLQVKQKQLSVEFINNTCNSFTNELNIVSEAVYIDTPFVLDDVNEFYNDIYHRDNLRSKLTREKAHALENVFDEAINSQKLELVMQKIGLVADGEFLIDGDSEYFKDRSLLKPLNLSNLSTGLKTFVILKKLIENGDITEDGILIFDEPEIHLHPEWQLIFAEILVLMQKGLNLNIILNTHSPYFLNAIEVFSVKHGISSKCKYYLADIINELAVFNDVTGNTELIYKKLAAPLQVLENIKYRME